MLLLAAGVGEAQVGELDVFFFDELHYVVGCHEGSPGKVEVSAVARASDIRRPRIESDQLTARWPDRADAVILVQRPH